MEQVIIGVTFFLGVGLTLVAIVALFRREKAGGGSLELLGVKLTASSASALFLVVGAAMILSGFAWASTDRKKTEAVKEATTFHAAYVKQVEPGTRPTGACRGQRVPTRGSEANRLSCSDPLSTTQG